MIVLGILVGLLILMLLVVGHEFGHFIMARKNGVKVNEFGIGFPPRAVAWVKKDGKWSRLPKSEWNKPQDSLILSLNWLPIGGFCSMDGESDADTRKGTFGATSFWSKTKILFGGVIMNWLMAFILLLILAFTGMPKFLPDQFTVSSDSTKTAAYGVVISSVLPDSPAERAGLKPGDYIARVGREGGEDSIVPAYPQEVIDYGNQHRGETGYYYVHSVTEEPRLVEVALNGKEEKYSLGTSLDYTLEKNRYTWSAPIVAAGTTLQLTGETFKGLGELVWNLFSGLFRQLSFNAEVREEGAAALGQAGDSVSGPVGIVGVLFPSIMRSGLPNLIFLAALISISLACMNVLPIPALDGGRWLLIAIYRLRGKKLTKETEEKIVSRAFVALLILIAVITVLDITKLFQ